MNLRNSRFEFRIHQVKYMFLYKMFLRCIVLETNSTLEYSERLYDVRLAFLEGYFCNLHSVRELQSHRKS